MKKRFIRSIFIAPALTALVWLGIFEGAGAGGLRPDGPHIFYQKDSLEIVEVVPTDLPDSCRILSRKIALRDTAGLRLLCRTEDGRDSFYFRLHRALPSPDSVPMPDRLLAVSDIEGNFWAFKRLLLGNGVVDSSLCWTFGKGHLALVGDFVDRGTDVTAVLWLIYKLEAEAAAAGGAVHYILGNHEEMILRGNGKYAQAKYKALVQSRGQLFRALYSENTEIGRWLRTKNALLRLGDEWMFLHAGLSQKVALAGLSRSQINDTIRAAIGLPANSVAARGGSPALLMGDEGPLWYRGFFGPALQNANAPASSGQIDTALAAFGVRHCVVGHTIVDSIGWHHAGRVMAIDLKHPQSQKKGEPKALWIEKGTVSETDGRGRKRGIKP